MRGDARTMLVERPRTAEDALATFAKEPGALPFAGGTDLMVSWNLGLLNGRKVLDLSGLAEWTKVSASKDGARVGALVTHAALQRHAAILKGFPLLAQACATVGAAQIQNRGTLGGNLANASPAGDTFPPLAVYEAVVIAASTGGTREIALSEFFAGVKKHTLRPGELVSGVRLPALAKSPTRAFFKKVGTRQAQAISKVVAAGLLWLNAKKEVEELRLALGSVATTVKRLKAVEAFVKGRKLTPDVVAEASALVASDISPIDDIRSTRDYRLTVSRNILRSFLENRA